MNEKATKKAPVGDGRIKYGESRNPGGLTRDERAARDAMRQALAEPGMRKRGLAAYERLLDADNPVIVKDFMDRLAGKVKERVEVSEDPESPRVQRPVDEIIADIVRLRVARGD